MGRRGEAVAEYKRSYMFAPADRQPEVLRRVVESDLERGDRDGAAERVRYAVDQDVTVPYTRDDARALHAQLQRERDEREAAKRAKRAAEERTDRERRERAERYGTEGDARQAVLGRLTFPAEARFHVLPYRDPPEELQADESWVVWGGVTAKNAFGVKEEMRWRWRWPAGPTARGGC